MVCFLLRKIFRGNLDDTISLAEIHFKMTSVSANEITPFKFPRKISFRGNCALKIESQACIQNSIKKWMF